MVGGLSAMYDEIDPALACEMAKEGIGNLPKWTRGRHCDLVNMTYICMWTGAVGESE